MRWANKPIRAAPRLQQRFMSTGSLVWGRSTGWIRRRHWVQRCAMVRVAVGACDIATGSGGLPHFSQTRSVDCAPLAMWYSQAARIADAVMTRSVVSEVPIFKTASRRLFPLSSRSSQVLSPRMTKSMPTKSKG